MRRKRIPLEQTSALQQREWLEAGRIRMNRLGRIRRWREKKLAAELMQSLIRDAVAHVEAQEKAAQASSARTPQLDFTPRSSPFENYGTQQRERIAEQVVESSNLTRGVQAVRAAQGRWRGAGGPPSSVRSMTARERIEQRPADIIEGSPDEIQAGRTIGPFGRGRGELYRDPVTLQWRLRRGTRPVDVDSTILENPSVPPEIQAANPGSTSYMYSRGWMPETRRQLAARLYFSQLPGTERLSRLIAPTSDAVAFSQNLQTFGFDPRSSPTGNPIAGQRPMPGFRNAAVFLWRDSSTMRNSIGRGVSSGFSGVSGFMKNMAAGVPTGAVNAFNAPGSIIYGGGNNGDADWLKADLNFEIFKRSLGYAQSFVGSLFPNVEDILAHAVSRKVRLQERPSGLTQRELISSTLQVTAQLPFMGLGDTPFQVGREAISDALNRYSLYGSKVNNKKVLSEMFDIYKDEHSARMERQLKAERVGSDAIADKVQELEDNQGLDFRRMAAAAASTFIEEKGLWGGFVEAAASVLGKEDPSKYVDTSSGVVGHGPKTTAPSSETWAMAADKITRALTIGATALGKMASRVESLKTAPGGVEEDF